MSQTRERRGDDAHGDNDLSQVVGYVLKQAATALRVGMDAVLRPMEMSVPQYACLELLDSRPGLSNAELARGAFVTRQSMNGVLRGLQDRGLVTRPTTAPVGRALPTQLTAEGRTKLHEARVAVKKVEGGMLADMSTQDQQRLLEGLKKCVAALGESEI